jgi:hypothetical protein
MENDRLREVASSSVQLTQILEELRGDGLPHVVGFNPLLHVDASDAVLDEFLSLAVREAADHVIFGLALPLSVCFIERGVGEEALEYCLDQRNLSRDQRESLFWNMSRRGTFEGLCAAQRRISQVAIRAGHTAHYLHQFLQDNIDELVSNCPEDLADFIAAPQFSPHNGDLDCLVLVMERSRNVEPYVRRWIDWIAEGGFDGPEPSYGNATVMWGYLVTNWDDARFQPVRLAAVAHVVHLLQSQENLLGAWHQFQGILSEARSAEGSAIAEEVRTAIQRSGLRRDQIGSDALRSAIDALWELSRDPMERSGKFQDLFMFFLNNPPTGT